MAISVVKGVHIDLTDDAVLDYSQDVDTAVMVGKFGAATAGVEGIAVAGSCGTAIVTGSGVAIVGEYIYPFPKYGRAQVGANGVACAFEGASASAGDGSVAWAQGHGTACVFGHGVASAFDSQAKGGDYSVAVSRRLAVPNVSASVGSNSVAMVYDDSGANGSNAAAVASALSGGVAVAFDGNHVQGAIGALLVATYIDANDQTTFATGVVDGVRILADTRYKAGVNGTLEIA